MSPARGGEPASKRPRPQTPAELTDQVTGLPGLKTWPRVYAVIVVSFLIWVALLYLLGKVFP